MRTLWLDELIPLRRAYVAAQEEQAVAQRALDVSGRARRELAVELEAVTAELNETAEAAHRAFYLSELASRRKDLEDDQLWSDEGRRLNKLVPPLRKRKRRLAGELEKAKQRQNADQVVLRQKRGARAMALRKFEAAYRLAILDVARLYPKFAKAIRGHEETAVVKLEASGRTSIYFGGVDGPKGRGHGHYVLDAVDYEVVYARNPFEWHGPENIVQRVGIAGRRRRPATVA